MAPTATCRTCGYCLYGLASPVCPECGRVFDPDDPSSFIDRVLRAEIRQARRILRWKRIARWPSHARAAVIVICCAFLFLRTGGCCFVLPQRPRTIGDLILGWAQLLAVIVLLPAVVALLRYAYAWLRLRRSGIAVDSRWQRRVAIACLAVCLLNMLWPLSLGLRFTLSRAALAAAAEAQRAIGSGTTTNQWIGLFHVKGIYLYNVGQVYFDTGCDEHFHPLALRGGLLYEPRGRQWAEPNRLCLLSSTWSVASFRRPYTLVDLVTSTLLPRLSCAR